jgi:NADH-quinone oxidoreductase subunit A
MPRSQLRERPLPFNLLEDPALPEQYYPVLLMLGIAIVMAIAILGLSQLLGKQTGGRVKGTTVESGVPMLDRSHKRISIAFFLIAIDFIVFDLEAAFLYPWALIMREGGWELFWAVMVFFFLILVGYAYVWLKGGLDLGARGKRLEGIQP